MRNKPKLPLDPDLEEMARDAREMLAELRRDRMNDDARLKELRAALRASSAPAAFAALMAWIAWLRAKWHRSRAERACLRTLKWAQWDQRNRNTRAELRAGAEILKREIDEAKRSLDRPGRG